MDSRGRTIWIADAHRGDGQRFVVHADEKLTTFLELESAIPRLRRIASTTWRDSLNVRDMKPRIPPVLITIALACFAHVQNTHAVSPPPDGGYPGGNTAEGSTALFSLTTGEHNTAVGLGALYSDIGGSRNTAIGVGALRSDRGGDSNTALGTMALYFNSNTGNTAIGDSALLNNMGGGANTATGFEALFTNRTGNQNTADGSQALHQNTTGMGNTATGYRALYGNTEGYFNTAFGAYALRSSTTLFGNTAIGYSALSQNEGGNNTASGYRALAHNGTGGENTANGDSALLLNTTGSGNTAMGSGALDMNTTGYSNTAIGVDALNYNTTGNGNVAVGQFAGLNITTGHDNIDIGNQAALEGESSTIRIGAQPYQTAAFIAGIYGQTTGSSITLPVIVDENGQLGTAASSKRFKTEIKPMDKTSEAIIALKPVTFHYKNDTRGVPQFGLVAEDVAKVNPDLVVRDKNGEVYTVRYDAVNAMLLNEFLKEHRTVQELKKEVAALTAGLQKVSAQLEASRPAPQVVNNNQ